MKCKINNKYLSQIRTKLIVFPIMLSFLLTSCASSRGSIFEGLYTTAFEVSVFHPCGVSIPTEFVEDAGFQLYWLESTPESGFNEQLKEFHTLREPTGELKLYVKFVGKTSPTKAFGYGHLGVFSNQITVTEVLDMKPWVDNQCLLE